jgi:dTDP-4-dehydrorhamnose 3,5-epimerase
MNVVATAIPDVLVIKPRVFEDSRGFFFETYQSRRFAEAGIDETFVQDNHSGSRQGVLRGLHFQTQHPQGKLVRVVVGSVYDVAVDLRPASATYGKWIGQNLSAETREQLWIPPGFVHGFYVTSDWAEVVYKVTDYWYPEDEQTLLWNDPEVGIDWPLVNGRPPMLSPKDAAGKTLRQLGQASRGA